MCEFRPFTIILAVLEREAKRKAEAARVEEGKRIAVHKRKETALRAKRETERQAREMEQRRISEQVQSLSLSLLFFYNLLYTPLVTCLILSPGAITLIIPSLLL